MKRIALIVLRLTSGGAQVVIGVDHTVAEVSNKKIAAQGTEARGREHHPPRRVEVAAGCETGDEIAVSREDIYVTGAHLGNRVVLGRILQRGCDPQIAGAE